MAFSEDVDPLSLTASTKILSILIPSKVPQSLKLIFAYNEHRLLEALQKERVRLTLYLLLGGRLSAHIVTSVLVRLIRIVLYIAPGI